MTPIALRFIVAPIARRQVLQELADKYSVADEYLLLAADCFLAEAEALDSAQPLLGWQAPEGPDQERNWQAHACCSELGIIMRRNCRHREGFDCALSGFRERRVGHIFCLKAMLLFEYAWPCYPLREVCEWFSTFRS